MRKHRKIDKNPHPDPFAAAEWGAGFYWSLAQVDAGNLFREQLGTTEQVIWTSIISSH